MRPPSDRLTITPDFLDRFSRVTLELAEFLRCYLDSLPAMGHTSEGRRVAETKRFNSFRPTVNTWLVLFQYMFDALPYHSREDRRLSVEVRAAVQEIDEYLLPLVIMSHIAHPAGYRD